ncbi:MAG TPA: hypothetical protein VF458_05705 [Ktedonobacteraceae bacterium]
MGKKFMSTILLFAVFIGFLWWGLAMLFGPHDGDPEPVVYALLLLACAGYALVSLLLLPRKKER